ncbi:fungal-specific transcription factor domain-containing protein [Xylariomycetidae sp. FL0641]|nr:fungal-specific transcription factor domain-containing protein [Xylariomycetidae sp. FL0641]
MSAFSPDAAATASLSGSDAGKASQACSSCRRQKRRCDKALPSCALCTRVGRECDYSETPSQPTIRHIEELQDQLATLESKLTQATTAAASNLGLNHLSPGSQPKSCSTSPRLLPAEITWRRGPNVFDPSLFLDRDLFQWVGLPVRKPTGEVPQDVLQCIGQGEVLQNIVLDYFGDVHPWLPMVSKKRIHFGYPSWGENPDIAFLYLAMALITSQPQTGFLPTENYIYIAAKRFSAQLDSVGTASLQYLQGSMLVALYEYGQGIHSAAWMTVAQCVRYADLIGLPSYKESNGMLGLCESWTEAEERRRTWWAVYVVDKIVSLGSQKRSLCGEPSPNEVLPFDDEAWDTGNASLAIQRTVSSPFHEPQSAFGRLCQSALLIGRLFRQSQRMESRRVNRERAQYAELTKLTDAAHSLGACLRADMTTGPSTYWSLAGTQCLVASVIMKTLQLYGPGATTRAAPSEGGLSAPGATQEHHQGVWAEENVAMQQLLHAQDGLRKTAAHVHVLAADLLANTALEEGLVKTTPLALDALYAAAAVSPAKEDLAALDTLRNCLLRVAGRWRLGAEYVKLLDFRDMHAAMMGHGQQALAAMPGLMQNMM